MNNMVLIAAAEAGGKIEDMQDAPLSERLTVAMKNTRRSWCCTDETEQFMAACEAVARAATDEERDQIKAELESMNRVASMFHALEAGVPVDLEKMAEDEQAREKTDRIGLRSLWEATA